MMIKKIVLVFTFSFVFAGLEFLLVIIFGNFRVKTFHNVGMITLFSSAVLVWFIIFGFFSTILNLAKNLKKVVQFLITLIIFLFLSLLLLIDFSSWKFFLDDQYFISLNAIFFALQNFWLFIKHIAVSDPKLIFTGFIFSISLAFGITFLLDKIATSEEMIRHKKKLFAVMISLILIFFLSFFQDESSYHPYFALLKNAGDDQKIDQKIMLQYLHLKKDFDQSKKIQKELACVFVILIESMRRDLFYEEPSPIPFMKDLAKNSLFFDRSYAASTHSDYSDPSIWYARYPLRRRDRLRTISAEKGLSIFRYFKYYGFQTGYISSQNENWGGMIKWLQDQGLDYFYHSEDHDEKTWLNEDDKTGLLNLILKNKATAGKIPDSETLAKAKKWLSKADKKNRLFLGMNLQNSHFDYFIPENGKEPFQPAKMDFPAVYAFWPKSKAEIVKNRYFNALYNLDLMIADFVHFLKERKLWENSYFLIIGDNGEAFYEHEFANHSSELYDEASRTFTLIKTPDDQQKIIKKAISHIDIFPTLLDLMNLPNPISFQGFSAFIPEKRSILIHNNAIIQQDALVYWPWKLLMTRYPYQEKKLYNLEKDPMEKIDLFDRKNEISDFMERKLKLISNVQLEYYQHPRYFIKYAPPRIY